MQVTDEMVERAKASLSHIRYGLSDAELRRALTAALSDKQAVEVKIKPLAWNPFRAETPFGYYHIDDQTDRSAEELDGRAPFLLSGSRIDLSRHPSLAEAKAAAQADYEQRIRSALVDVPAVEPVAWLDDGSCRAGSDRTAHRVVTEEQKRGMPAAIAESFTTPLYTSPPLSREGEDSAEVMYAERLATALHEKHYAASAPDWKPLRGDLIGLLTQIDNMIAGLSLAGTHSGSATTQKGCGDE